MVSPMLRMHKCKKDLSFFFFFFSVASYFLVCFSACCDGTGARLPQEDFEAGRENNTWGHPMAIRFSTGVKQSWEPWRGELAVWLVLFIDFGCVSPTKTSMYELLIRKFRSLTNECKEVRTTQIHTFHLAWTGCTMCPFPSATTEQCRLNWKAFGSQTPGTKHLGYIHYTYTCMIVHILDYSEVTLF